MKSLLPVVVFMLLLVQACKKPAENAFMPLDGGRILFSPDCNCLYSDSTIKKLQLMVANGLPFDSLVAETSKLIAKDTLLLARDSLKATVRVMITSAVGGFGARLNGIEVGTSSKVIPIFPDSICFWIKAYGTQGTLTGNIFINNKKKAFEFKDYDAMTPVMVKMSLKDFKEVLPRKPKSPLTIPPIAKDSVIARSK